MTVTTSVRTVNRLFTVREGTYGSTHDPYGWFEWEVTDLRTGESARLREDGYAPYPDQEDFASFEEKSGFSPEEVDRLIDRYQKHLAKDSQYSHYREADEKLLRYAR